MKFPPPPNPTRRYQPTLMDARALARRQVEALGLDLTPHQRVDLIATLADTWFYNVPGAIFRKALTVCPTEPRDDSVDYVRLS